MRVLLILAIMSLNVVAGDIEAELSSITEFIDKNKLEEASVKVQNLLRNFPDNLEVNFLEGILAYKRGEYVRAILAFERALYLYPEHVPSLIMLGICEMAIGYKDQALRRFDKASSIGIPSEKESIFKKFLEEYKSYYRSVGWYSKITVGIRGVWDSNVNLGPDNDLIKIRPITMGDIVFMNLSLSEKSKPVDTFGSIEIVDMYIEKRSELLTGPRFLLYCEGKIYGYTYREKDYNTYIFDGFLGFKRQDNRIELRLPINLTYINYNAESLVGSAGLSPVLILNPAGKVSWISNFIIEKRDYAYRDDRNSVFLNFQERINFYDAYLKFGISVEYANEDIYSYTGAECGLGFVLLCPLNIVFTAEVDYSGSNFKERESLAPEKREDKRWVISGMISKKVMDRLYLNASVERINNHSTFDIYDYNRTVISAGLSKVF